MHRVLGSVVVAVAAATLVPVALAQGRLAFEDTIDELASDGFLGDDDLAWIDELDDAELEKASRALEHHHRKGS